jgi:hypothetical protein
MHFVQTEMELRSVIFVLLLRNDRENLYWHREVESLKMHASRLPKEICPAIFNSF